MIRHLLSTLLLLALSYPSIAQEMMPPGNLRIPLLLRCEDGRTGTGFYFEDGRYSYLVTAKHVLYEGDNLRGNTLNVYLYTTPTMDMHARLHATVNLNALNADGLIIHHRSHDVVVCRVGRIQMADDGRRQVVRYLSHYRKETPIEGEETMISNDMVMTLADVPIGNDVYIFGYPSSIGIQQLPQIEYEKPLLRKGIVAGKNLIANTIILDCPVYPGNSGGPVLIVVREGGRMSLRVIGVISQMIPYIDEWRHTRHGLANIQIQNSGYSVVIPMDFVLDLCNQLSEQTPAGDSQKLAPEE